MSHFIENSCASDDEPILKTISRQITVPTAKTLKNNQSCNEKESEHKMMKVVFFQLQNSQYERERQQNAVEMRRKFKKLQAKLSRKTQQQNAANILKNNRMRLPRLQLVQLVRLNAEKIDSVKRQRANIKGRLSLYRETESIMAAKQQYHNWYDATKNNPMNCPIFSKMTYILEKINHKQKLSHSPEQKPKQRAKLLTQGSEDDYKKWSKGVISTN